MKKVRIITIVGARPQFIKASVVSRAIKEHFTAQMEENLLHTGQHYDEDMSAVFFEKLGMPRPKFQLQMGQSALSPGQMAGAIAEILRSEKPDAVMVYGDTDSTRAGAIAAAVTNTPLIHVEAGLRSGNWAMPEEENRVVTDHLADLLFCPTLSSTDILKQEGPGRDSEKVFFAGDVMLDSALHHAGIADFERLRSELKIARPYLLLTLHRGANVDEVHVLEEILNAVNEIASEKGFQAVLPMHPRTRKTLAQKDISQWHQLRVIGPQDYESMLCLEQNAEIIFTDSGGVQKEAYFFGKPCCIMRNETEWTELVSEGGHVLCGQTAASIRNGFARLVGQTATGSHDIFGNGGAGLFICRQIIQRYGK